MVTKGRKTSSNACITKSAQYVRADQMWPSPRSQTGLLTKSECQWIRTMRSSGGTMSRSSSTVWKSQNVPFSKRMATRESRGLDMRGWWPDPSYNECSGLKQSSMCRYTNTRGILSPGGRGHTFPIFLNLRSKPGVALFVAQDDEPYVLVVLA